MIFLGRLSRSRDPRLRQEHLMKANDGDADHIQSVESRVKIVKAQATQDHTTEDTVMHKDNNEANQVVRLEG